MNLLKLIITFNKTFLFQKKLFFLFFAIYLIQFSLGVVIIYYSYTEQLKAALRDIVESVQADIKFQDGKWDLSEYYADPDIPGRFRLSVFLTDGFVVDRWRPIPGFLDTSDFKHLLTYTTPQTIQTPTNQIWRMYSKPITDSVDNNIGVITVSFFNPQGFDIESIDKKLIDTTENILQKIEIKGENIDTKNLEIKNLPFDVTFQIVDKFNTILAKNNNSSSMDRIPNFIDPSYVQQELHAPDLRVINDKNHQDTFLIKSQLILDENGSPIGVVIAATLLTLMYDILKTYIYVQLIAGVFIILFFSLLANYMIKGREELRKFKKIILKDLKQIQFSKKDCSVEIEGVKITFNYATNQYYMCLAVFSSPKKKWEMDELLDKFGMEKHNKTNWRIVYDTMSAINKKFSSIIEGKLIIVNNKTYCMNPKITNKIFYI